MLGMIHAWNKNGKKTIKAEKLISIRACVCGEEMRTIIHSNKIAVNKNFRLKLDSGTPISLMEVL